MSLKGITLRATKVVGPITHMTGRIQQWSTRTWCLDVLGTSGEARL